MVEIEELELIAEWRVNKREVYRVRVVKVAGKRFTDLRKFYRDADGNWCPGKGSMVPMRDLGKLRKALKIVKQECGDAA